MNLLDLQPWRVLVIAAHPGDIEYAASAAVAKWTSEGAEVVYLIASRGETGIPGIEPDEAALIRSAEQSAAAAAVGVHIVDFLDVNDGTIEPTVAIRRAMVADIRRFGPDVVMVMNHRERTMEGAHNNADHRSTGIVALDAVSSAANQWVFRDIGRPHTVDSVLVANSPDSTHAIDVSGFEDAAVNALALHGRQLAAIAAHPMGDPNQVRTRLQTWAGNAQPAGAALPVELIAYGMGQPCQSAIIAAVEGATDDKARIMKLPKHAKKSQTPARSRNAAPHKSDRKKAAKAPGKSAVKTTAKKTAAKKILEPVGTMRFKARLEKNGKSIGIEVPDKVVQHLGGGNRPAVAVEVNKTTFDAALGTTGGKRFVALNADRRKKAGIEVDDTFFVTLSVKP